MSPSSAVEPPFGAARPQGSYAFEVAVVPEPHRVAQLRLITKTFLRYRAVPAPLAQDVVVVVSELVTNSVEHGHGTVSLRVRHTGGELFVETTDDNPAPARLRPPTPDDERGRGLFLVSCLSQSWGVSDDGRTTWASFHASSGRP
ncbi:MULTISPECIES: ATP-binding protein [unclassified Streptomyces]|uniref:ATP-binding protein n=1 Tax=unclassified Streptomyces TaxID=2593676 RepID=UPI0001C19909|nr:MULTISPECIES: ATP-binding protein [unclassified Streptomyces]AEN10847.1 putative anti-sigma regulatory factor, serine/threonine protein kinase [Streptomyces sp. SirexAA-E]MYR69248.1 ATP-binding protein [Streptomyces sp. SID4939]MYS01043.1 ATP-binding protein [Streptomyces sp. SID4940]MYT63886.1 ATP-binding protein [Streptomyces sp. SID8357]MYT86136.1 ATP-binding protein [Streptomyces sp. SID8360]